VVVVTLQIIAVQVVVVVREQLDQMVLQLIVVQVVLVVWDQHPV